MMEEERIDIEIVVHPPVEIYKKAKEKWGVDFKDVIFTVGNMIHHHKDKRLTPELLQHELVHVKQQAAYGVEAWWDRYFEDDEFRLSQEVPAYQVQYQVARENIKDRNQLTKYLFEIASYLSGKIYGNIIGHSEAVKLIKQ